MRQPDLTRGEPAFELGSMFCGAAPPRAIIAVSRFAVPSRSIASCISGRPRLNAAPDLCGQFVETLRTQARRQPVGPPQEAPVSRRDGSAPEGRRSHLRSLRPRSSSSSWRLMSGKATVYREIGWCHRRRRGTERGQLQRAPTCLCRDRLAAAANRAAIFSDR